MGENNELVLEWNRLLQLRKSAKDKAYMKIWQGAWKQDFENNIEKLNVLCSDGECEILENYIRRIKRGVKYAFFTINPRDDVTIEDFRRKIEKCLKKVWIGNWLWNMEQRGISDDDYGFEMHCNILMEVIKYKKPSELKREVFNTFKNLVGNGMHVCMRFGMDCTNFVNYIYGIKKDESKNNLLEMDKVWRYENNIEDVYFKEDWRVVTAGGELN